MVNGGRKKFTKPNIWTLTFRHRFCGYGILSLAPLLLCMMYDDDSSLSLLPIALRHPQIFALDEGKLCTMLGRCSKRNWILISTPPLLCHTCLFKRRSHAKASSLASGLTTKYVDICRWRRKGLNSIITVIIRCEHTNYVATLQSLIDLFSFSF